jgi:uncharacterized protein HemX
MPRLPTLLLAAVLALGIGGMQLAQSQTEPAAPTEQTAPAPKAKKARTAEEKAKLKQERAAKKAARQEKKAAKAAKKAKREQCRTQGKQDNLKGKKLRAFVQTCIGN